MTQDTELESPESAEPSRPTLLAGDDAIEMKGDVSGFVADDKRAHFLERPVGDLGPKDAVVRIAHDLGQEESLNLKTHPEPAAAKIESAETPMAGDVTAAETVHGAAQQASVFPFLVEPEIDDLASSFRFAAESFGVEGDEASRAAAVAEFELFERRKKTLDLNRAESGGGLPIGLGPVKTVGVKMSDPLTEDVFGGVVRSRGKAGSRAGTRIGMDLGMRGTWGSGRRVRDRQRGRQDSGRRRRTFHTL